VSFVLKLPAELLEFQLYFLTRSFLCKSLVCYFLVLINGLLDRSNQRKETGGTFNALGGKLGRHTAWREALNGVYDIEKWGAEA